VQLPETPSTHPDDYPELPGKETVRREVRKDTLADSGGTDFRHGRFVPGQRLGERYRIVALLGQGGMGEVYRADDLELGQSVALKFLPQRVAADPAWLRRFRNEVRTAREVAHANVCRIYDIAEEDGHVFLSMEYIDGEDLAGVLRRLGRPSREKAIEISRQICLGLAAAHENKVLHRDLKPANIMIDGRGRVRITDFGLAGFLDDLEQAKASAGTPAYMAPEQLTQGKVSVRSDIYTLGLILHELFTGRSVFETDDIEELKRKHTSGSVTPPSTLTEEIDPAVERVIMRCLEQAPEQRPQSVYQVLAALPGGDPLAAALAAGETPSPELVAHARDAGGLRPPIAIGLLVALIVSLAITYVVSYGTTVMPERSPAVLAVVAEQILEELGYDDLPRNSVSGYDVNTQLAGLLRSSPIAFDELAEKEWPPRFRYWRRWSRGAFASLNYHFPSVFVIDGPTDAPYDTATVATDSTGRLLALQVPPAFAGPSSEPVTEVDWSPIFERAGLQQSKATEISPVVTPRILCDEVAAWHIDGLGGGGEPMTVLMGAVAGRPTYFEFVGLHDDMTPIHDADPGADAGQLVWLVFLIFFIFLAWRNLRAGRVDRRHALLAALLIGGLYALMEILSISLGGSDRLAQVVNLPTGRAAGHVLQHAVETWLLYIAVEPYVRRLWPRMLVGVVRLLSGRARDPAVGREVLIGLVSGCAVAAVLTLVSYGEWRLRAADFADLPFWTSLRTVLSPGHFASNRAHITAWAVLDGAWLAGLLVGIRLLVRHSLTTVCLGVLLIGSQNFFWFIFFGGYSNLVALAFGAGFGVGVVMLMTRVGVLAAIVFFFVIRSWDLFTLEFDRWTTPYGLTWLAILVALAAYGFVVSLAGQPIFKDMLAEPQPAP
jgi:serine/threonine-protein kinase